MLKPPGPTIITTYEMSVQELFERELNHINTGLKNRGINNFIDLIGKHEKAFMGPQEISFSSKEKKSELDLLKEQVLSFELVY